MTGHAFLQRLAAADLVGRTGRVRRITPTFIEADGPDLPLGALCAIEDRSGPERPAVLAQVVGVQRETVALAPLDPTKGVVSGARVTALAEADRVAVGDAFLARAVDALGRPIDGAGPVRASRFDPMTPAEGSPLDRAAPDQVLETGVRAIDTLLTLVRGGRIGVFAASGVGKTTLMTQLAQQVGADRCVICLVGERGREVEALWSRDLSPEAKAKTVLVAATSDQTAAMRVRAVDYALALAEAWRRDGKHVLLLLDSMTRYAMALREIGLAAGEPPTVRAYTPGVFAAIPRIVERCGAWKSGGAISAVMTVLSESDEIDDPISEMMKSLLDGHILLARPLAEKGHFPAIDAPRSISRLATALRSPAQQALAAEASARLSVYEASRLLIETGVYVRGGDPAIDRAIASQPALMQVLQQRPDERISLASSFESLAAALQGSL